MSVDVHPRLPLVLAATRNASGQAALLLPGVILENAVTDAIARGEIAHDRRRGRAVVFLDERDVLVSVRRIRSASSGRLAWQPFKVEAKPQRQRQSRQGGTE